GDERFADAAELTHELETLIRTQGWDSSRHSPASIPAAEHPGGASPPADTSPIPAGRRGRWIGAGVALAVLAALLWWRAPHDDSPGFVTDVRAAVLPITDRTDSQWSSLAAGLTTVLTEALEDCARQVPSMWVAPLRHVEYADPSGPAEAQEALGVNRVVSGNLQTFGDGLRLSLAGFFPGGRERPRVTTIDFSPEDPSKLRANIPAFLVQTIPAAGQASTPEILPAGAAGAAYLRGVGSLPADPAGAVRELRLATEQAPDFTPARGRLGLAWLRLFDATGDSAALVHSLETLRSLRDDGSAGPTHLEWLGDAYERLRAPDSAVASYRAALALDPGRSYAAREIARALRKSSRFDEGTAVLRAVIAREPDYFANHRDLAAHFYRSGLPDSAALEFERSLALAPRDNFSLNALGAIHYAAGHWAEARSFFERSFRLVPSYDACSNVGAMYYYEGDFENSARYYEIALAYADSTNPNTWGNLAKSLHWIPGQHAACDSLLRRAIRLVKARTAEDPSDVEGLVNLVDFQAMLGDSTAALALLPEVSRRAGDDGNRRYRLGCAWEMLGERENALQELFRALRLGVPLWVLEGTPELADLRTDARFADFVGGSEDAGH
ncbi:MAG: tetratricopeptide repeat protein, partial [Gemmatimonadetes bacterium]|nr:tetratricopeptide repeat protein [Gemmatimonadota bacterium]